MILECKKKNSGYKDLKGWALRDKNNTRFYHDYVKQLCGLFNQEEFNGKRLRLPPPDKPRLPPNNFWTGKHFFNYCNTIYDVYYRQVFYRNTKYDPSEIYNLIEVHPSLLEDPENIFYRAKQ